MTMLVHSRGPFERARHSSPRRDRAATRPAAAYLTMIKRFLTVLGAGAALAAVIALKAALFFWVYHYY